MDLGLRGKTALVTGASAGLGLAAARALHDEGARVAICSRDEKRITAAARSIVADPAKVLPIVCDLTAPEQIDALITGVEKQFGRVDILVTNCGGPPTGRHDTVTAKDWELGYNLTFMSTIRLIEKVVPGMKRQKSGRVILLTSASAKQPIDNLLLSNTYRAGLLGYAKTLSNELGPLGITVNTVMPGYTRTERLNYLASSIASQTGKSEAEVFAGWTATIPLGRLGKPEELGALVAFLASEWAGFITGTATAIDGGRILGI
jgi:3-oxoacyl-[acyl-carrier protein] reductase